MRYTLASLIASGDHLLWTDERFRQEIGQWKRPAQSMRLDGVLSYALGTGNRATYLDPLKIRTFMDNEEIRNKSHPASGSPVLPSSVPMQIPGSTGRRRARSLSASCSKHE